MAKKTLIGYQASEDELAIIDDHWKKVGAGSRSEFLRSLVERELSGDLPAKAPATAAPDIVEELAALALTILSCWQKAASTAEAKTIVQQFFLSGAARDLLQKVEE